ncbi:hypothetical protein FACS1894176_06190 [Bacteroidia bacterium]|nr:hypothetical protein FACS1894176_06190 [Bacteroidia bacterium]
MLSAGTQYFKTLVGGGTVYYGDIVTYQLHLSNVGPVRLEEVKFDDLLPPELELVSADIVSAQGGTVSVSGNALHFDFSGCVNSQYFPSPATSSCYNQPTAATATIKARITTPTDACKTTVINNTASYDILSVSTSHLNDDSAMTGVVNGSGVATSLHGEGSRAFYANPLKGEFSLSLNGSTNIQVKEKGSYTLTIANQGKDASLNTTVTILVPKLTINGVEKYVSIINVEGGVVDYSDIAQGKIYVHLEELLAGRTKTVKFGIGTIPSGIAA